MGRGKYALSGETNYQLSIHKDRKSHCLSVAKSMIAYEQFKTRNLGFNGGWNSEKVHQNNYGIAQEIERVFMQTYGNIDGPRMGDIVEFSDGWEVYERAQVCESCYGGSKYGMMCVCERGSSWTDGNIFSTSGGAFKSIHKSKFQYAGETEVWVWTWGCFGSGANMGIYFPLKVRKWIIPYEPVLKRSMVKIRKHNEYAVFIENYGDLFNALCFTSVKAYLAWAKYVGYKTESWVGTFEKVSPQKIVRKWYTKPENAPTNGKPIKVLDNGRVKDGYVVTTDQAIIYHIPNYGPYPEYGTPEYEKEFQDHRKYAGNPMGV